ncbi:MAG: hypothetical protein U5L09_16850 [Bacteroidales bacterium]|nr:hypothetical protein [Bacteroidales bacterium]
MNPVKKKTEARVSQIRKLANFVSKYYIQSNSLDLYSLLKDEDISLFFDHYEGSFDGLLVYETNKFYIHLDIDNGNTKHSRRSRFSIAQ